MRVLCCFIKIKHVKMLRQKGESLQTDRVWFCLP